MTAVPYRNPPNLEGLSVQGEGEAESCSYEDVRLVHARNVEQPAVVHGKRRILSIRPPTARPSPGADVAGASPVPAQMWQKASAVSVQMWQHASPVSAQM